MRRKGNEDALKEAQAAVELAGQLTEELVSPVDIIDIARDVLLRSINAADVFVAQHFSISDKEPF